MPAPRPRSPPRGWAARRCCSRTASKRSARCRAIRRSAASARATSSRRSTRSAARWRIATDEAGIQFRTLNASKGPAVRATRAQADRRALQGGDPAPPRERSRTSRCSSRPSTTSRSTATARCAVTGVITQIGVTFEADAVVLTTGTFLSGLIHVGLEHYEAGRAGDPPAKTLGARLRELGCRSVASRPARRRGSTAARSTSRRSNVQPGDDPAPVFELHRHARDASARRSPCWITHTNERTHDIIRGGLDRSPLFTGVIKGVGPRYCPSIEDKVVRFAERDEPPDLPRARRPRRRTRSIRTASRRRCRSTCSSRSCARSQGCEHAHILRPGYAIEYDYFDPRALQVDARNQGDPRPLLRRPDQRHDRLRGSRGAGSPGRHQRRALRARRERLVAAPRRSVSRRAGRRSRHARRHRAVPDVHVARRVPAAAARGQRGPAPDRARPRARRRRRCALGCVLRASATRSRASSERLKSDVGQSRGRVARTTRSACSGSRWSASTRCRSFCAGRASTYASLMTLPGAGAAVADPLVAEQVEVATKYAGYIDRQQRRDRARARSRRAARFPPISTTARCAVCPTRCSRSSTCTSPKRSARRRAFPASRRRRSRCCSCI